VEETVRRRLDAITPKVSGASSRRDVGFGETVKPDIATHCLSPFTLTWPRCTGARFAALRPTWCGHAGE